MMIQLKCPHCAKDIRAPDQQAGKRVRCPGCKEVLTVPAGETAVQSAPPPAPKPKPPPVKKVAVEEEPIVLAPAVEESDDNRPRRKASSRRADDDEDDRPRRRRDRDDDDDDDDRQRRRRSRDYDDDDDEDDRPRKRRRRRGAYADCPNCDAPGDAALVTWTLWGGFVGPWLLTHVRCNRCGTCYNGKSGKYNTTAIILYIVIPLIISIPFVMCAVLGALMGNH